MEKEFNKRKKQLIKTSIDQLLNKLNKLIIYHSAYFDGLYGFNLKTDDCFNKAFQVVSEESTYKKLINFQ